MAKRGVDDAMFCEACGAHRDQLGLAGDEIRTCPGCGRATCSNCWNQVAGACLACRAFALPFAAAPVRDAMQPTATGLPKQANPSPAVSVSGPPVAPRRFTRAAKPRPDPVVSKMPGVVGPALAPSPVRATSGTLARFGHIRIGRVIRATAIGSVLAVSIAAVGFAGVLRLGPSAEAAPRLAAPETAPPNSILGDPDTAPAPVATDVARPTTAPIDAAVTTGPDDRGVSPAANGMPSSDDPTDRPPAATNQPAGTATPTAGATATPVADPTATPESTPDPATPTPDPPTPTPDPPTPEPPTPTPDPATPEPATPEPPTPAPET